MEWNWEVDVGYPMEYYPIDEIEHAGYVVSSGAGFGYRNIQFGCHTEKEAKELAETIYNHLKSINVPVTEICSGIEEDKAYVSYYPVEDIDDKDM